VILGSIAGRATRFLISPKCSQWVWNQHSLLCNGWWGLFTEGCSSWVMKCAAVLHIVSRLRVNGAVPPLLLSVLWCGQEQLNLLCVVTSSYSCVVFMYTAQLDGMNHHNIINSTEGVELEQPRSDSASICKR